MVTSSRLPLRRKRRACVVSVNVGRYAQASPIGYIQWLTARVLQQYEKEGKWIYEQHPFWCTGYTFWDLHSEAPDLFLHLSRSDLVFFKGDLNHRKVSIMHSVSAQSCTDHPRIADVRLRCSSLD